MNGKALQTTICLFLLACPGILAAEDSQAVKFSHGSREVPTYTFERSETIAPLFRSIRKEQVAVEAPHEERIVSSFVPQNRLVFQAAGRPSAAVLLAPGSVFGANAIRGDFPWELRPLTAVKFEGQVKQTRRFWSVISDEPFARPQNEIHAVSLRRARIGKESRLSLVEVKSAAKPPIAASRTSAGYQG